MINQEKLQFLIKEYLARLSIRRNNIPSYRLQTIRAIIMQSRPPHPVAFDNYLYQFKGLAQFPISNLHILSKYFLDSP